MLDTVSGYIAEARVLLQDEVAPYRNSDNAIKQALGLGVLEIKRIRPDAFAFQTVPDISSASAPDDPVAVPDTMRLALLYFVVGQVGIKDDEEGAESRAAGFQRAFVGKLLSVAS